MTEATCPGRINIPPQQPLRLQASLNQTLLTICSNDVYQSLGYENSFSEKELTFVIKIPPF